MLISSLVVNNSFAQSWYDKQKKCEADISKDATPKEKLDRHNYCKKLTESYLKSHDKYGELKPPKKAQTKYDFSHEPTYESNYNSYKAIGNILIKTNDGKNSKWCKGTSEYCGIEDYAKCQNKVSSDKSLSPAMKRAKLKECAHDAGLKESRPLWSPLRLPNR